MEKPGPGSRCAVLALLMLGTSCIREGVLNAPQLASSRNMSDGCGPLAAGSDHDWKAGTAFGDTRYFYAIAPNGERSKAYSSVTYDVETGTLKFNRVNGKSGGVSIVDKEFKQYPQGIRSGPYSRTWDEAW